MKTQQRTWQYLTLIAVVAVGFSCNTSKQTAQTGEADDLYGNSGNAAVYADNSRDYTEKRPATARTESNRNTGPLRRNNRNANPDYTNDQQPYSANEDEYYSELSTRNLNRGISDDPGWGSNNNGNGSYNDGFTNGYYAGLNNPAYNSSRWNQWGFNNGFNTGFNVGLGLGGGFGGFGGFNRWGGGFGGFNRWGGGFYDPFWGDNFAYSPWGFNNGWGGGFNDPFYSPFGFGGFNSWNSPFGYGGGWGGGGFNNRPVYVNNNVIVSGADPYRNTRTYGARTDGASGRYNDGFTNTPRPASGNTGGRSAATGTYNPSDNGGNATGNANTSRDGYYASPRQNNRGTYYSNDGNSNGRGSAVGNSNSPSTYSPPASSNSGSGEYYARPRQNSQGSYTPSNNGNGNSRDSYQRSEPSRSQPSYQPQNRSYQQQSQPTQSQPSYSAPSPSYNGGGSRGSSSDGGGSSSGGGGSSSGGGGGRGPR